MIVLTIFTFLSALEMYVMITIMIGLMMAMMMRRKLLPDEKHNYIISKLDTIRQGGSEKSATTFLRKQRCSIPKTLRILSRIVCQIYVTSLSVRVMSRLL